MGYLIANFWLPITIAAVLGLCVGWATCRKGDTSWRASWLPFGIIAFVAGLFLAIQMVMLGRLGLWLDVGLLLLAAYFVSCCAGCIARWAMLGEGNDADAHVADDYTGKVAAIGTSEFSAGQTSTTWLNSEASRAALRRTYALVPSSTDYTMTVAGINTLAADAIARAYAAANAHLTGRPAPAPRADYVHKVAAINTTAQSAPTKPIATVVKAGIVNPDAASFAAEAPAAAATNPPVAHPNSVQLAAVTTPPTLAEMQLMQAEITTYGIKPLLFDAPMGGKRDELSLIWGIAEKLETRMNDLGIWHFNQIADWTPHNVTWFETTIEGFKGRVERDKWIEQCKKLGTGWRPDSDIGERPKF